MEWAEPLVVLIGCFLLVTFVWNVILGLIFAVLGVDLPIAHFFRKRMRVRVLVGRWLYVLLEGMAGYGWGAFLAIIAYRSVATMYPRILIDRLFSGSLLEEFVAWSLAGILFGYIKDKMGYGPPEALSS